MFENTEENFLKILQDDRDRLSAMQFEMNKDFGDKRISIVNERREFYQHLTLLALGLLGATFFTDKIVHVSFFFAGLLSLVCLVLAVVFWLREIYDKESKDLVALQDKYNNVSEEKDELIDKFAIKPFHPNILKEYAESIQNLRGAFLLQEDVDSQREERKNREQEQLDYFGELVIFLFVVGAFFLFLSVVHQVPSIPVLFFSLLLIFSLSFQDFFLRMMMIFSKLPAFLNRKAIKSTPWISQK